MIIQQNIFISKFMDKALFDFIMLINSKISIRILTVALVLLTSLSACNSESGKSNLYPSIPIETAPTDNLRSYLLGDTIVFSGSVTIKKPGVPTWTSPVEVLVELLPGKFDYLDKIVLKVRRTITFLRNGEQQVIEQNIWQESNGKLFELSNEYGNEYVIGASSEKGLLAIPVPFIDFEENEVFFSTLYRSHVSGPITIGSRAITYSPIQTIDFLQ